jgi:hypothetical protein
VEEGVLVAGDEQPLGQQALDVTQEERLSRTMDRRSPWRAVSAAMRKPTAQTGHQ